MQPPLCMLALLKRLAPGRPGRLERLQWNEMKTKGWVPSARATTMRFIARIVVFLITTCNSVVGTAPWIQCPILLEYVRHFRKMSSHVIFRTSPLLGISTSRLDRLRFLLMGTALKEKPEREREKNQPAGRKSRLPFYSCQEIDKVRSFAQVLTVIPFRDLYKWSLFFLEVCS